MPKALLHAKEKWPKTLTRAGRPFAAQAGEVDARLLDAATQLFLARGFEATSCDQVATAAGAGKASLYARYANKEALFAAVVRRNVERTLTPSHDVSPQLAIADRLRTVGIEILEQTMMPDAVGMMRMVIATANRFPELAQLADRIGWEGGVERVVKAITAGAANSPDDHMRAKPLAAWFIALTFAPHQMRALLGDSPALLHAAAPKRVDEAVTILARSGWLDGWE